MRRSRQQREPASAAEVAGLHLPPPRPTGWAVLYGVAYLGLPLLVLLLLADLLLHLAVTRLLDRCYGIVCLLG